MAISFAKMKLKVDNSVNKFDFKYNNEIFPIEVFRYLSISDKNDLVQIALQKANENGVINDIALDMYFNLNLVYLYTNINFTDKQKEDEADLYDKLQCSGLIDQVIAHMDQDEYKHLLDYLDSNRRAVDEHNHSVGGFMETLVNDLPIKMQQTMDVIDANKDKFPEVERLAKLASETGMNNNKVAAPVPKDSKVVPMPSTKQ